MRISSFQNIRSITRERCEICGKSANAPLIELPNFPITEVYVPARQDVKLGFLDQSFHVCDRCGHGQMSNVIDNNLQYGDPEAYFFRSSTSLSGTVTAHFFRDFVAKVVGSRRFQTGVEIGCNDLYLLKSLRFCCDNLIGIDPILREYQNDTGDANIRAIGEFFEDVDLQEDVDLILCKDALEHVSRPGEFIEKALEKISDGGLLFFQFPILDILLEDCRFDQVFHQHVNYFSFRSIEYLLKKLGCGIVDYAINRDHWGSLLIAFEKGGIHRSVLPNIAEIDRRYVIERYEIFRELMINTGKRLFLLRKEVIYGYGAALMLPVLSYHLGDDFATWKSIIDDDVAKDGLYYINLPVPITHSSKIDDLDGAVVVLTAIFSKMVARHLLLKLLSWGPKRIVCPLIEY